MNLLDRLNQIVSENARGDVYNTAIDISPEAFDLLIRLQGAEVQASDGIRARQAQPVDIRFFAWILESDRLTGDEFAVHLQNHTVVTGGLCRSNHERMWWHSQRRTRNETASGRSGSD